MPVLITAEISMRRHYYFSAALLLSGTAFALTLVSPVELGQLFFFDPTLSSEQDMGCFTCHQPAFAFTDARQNAGKGMVSPGSGGMRYGIRNAPPITYAANSPPFHFDAANGLYVGGQFWDGRARDLEEQITGPLFASFEMNMADSLAVVARLEKNPQYAYNLKAHYGKNVFNIAGKPGLGYQSARAFAEMQNTIAAYERSPAFRSYDSKYDRYLQGKATLTPLEESGRQIFFDPARSNCTACHLAKAPGSAEEPFSSYYYFNVGTPRNLEMIRLAGRPADYIDHGLKGNPKTDGADALDGKFRTPTLRNVAVTAPYMHNGVIPDLRGVLHFFDHFNQPRPNPATGRDWDTPEVPDTVDSTRLNAPPLSDADLDALEAFLRTLTDARYEALLPPQAL